MSANVTYTTNHRQLWINYYGPIPKDEQGRSYEIHHINGDHADNRIENLKCVSIQEHYDIHFKQCDWTACTLIARRLNMSAEEKSHLLIAYNKNRVKSGTHPWLKHNIVKKECQWCHRQFNPNVYTRFHGDYCKSNPNAMLRKPIQKRECQWCHQFATPSNYKQFHGDRCLSNPNSMPRKKKECQWCRMIIDSRNYVRYHGNYCRSNPNALPKKLCKPHKQHKPITKKECQWCHRSFAPAPYSMYHGDKCKTRIGECHAAT